MIQQKINQNTYRYLVDDDDDDCASYRCLPGRLHLIYVTFEPICYYKYKHFLIIVLEIKKTFIVPVAMLIDYVFGE